ncbi:hypothetical protein RB213_000497 [Colletotrichum asianum]
MGTSLLLSQMPLRPRRKQWSTIEDEPAVRSGSCKLEGLNATSQRARPGLWDGSPLTPILYRKPGKLEVLVLKPQSFQSRDAETMIE